MTRRTSERIVTFRKPFTLGENREIHAPGKHLVVTEEELIEDLSFAAYRRILTEIHLPPIRRAPSVTRVLPIDPKDLDAAIKRDEEATFFASAEDDSLLIDEPTDDNCVLEAIEVGENEGMVVLHTHRSPQPSGGAGNEENKSTLLKLKAFLRRISPSSSPRVQPDVQTWGNGEFSELSGADLERLLKQHKEKTNLIKIGH